MTFATRLDQPPWDGVHRVILGGLIYAALSRLLGEHASPLAWSLSFLGILLALRVIPAVIRKVVPFSDAAQAIWSARRQMAKRYDSYQWQKLFWIGLGMAAQAALSDSVGTAPLVLTSACVLSGAAGFVVWKTRKTRAVLV